MLPNGTFTVSLLQLFSNRQNPEQEMLNAAEDRKKNKATGTAFHCNSSNTHILSQDCSPEMKDAVRCCPIHFVIHFVSNQMLRRVERCPTLSHASADYQLSLSLRFFPGEPSSAICT